MRAAASPRPMPEWSSIDTVLLDMDGTLLDKHFDDHFWEEYVPERYASSLGIPVPEARRRLTELYRAHEGTLNWTDLDFWSRELGLDIPALKRQVDHLIALHPRVLPFLQKVRLLGKNVYLVTNAHGKTLSLKMEKTALSGIFCGIFTSHDLGAPKEDGRFWDALRERVPFDPQRTLLVEDTEAVLESAEGYGIRFLVKVAKPSSRQPAAPSRRFFSIATFKDITPQDS